MISSCSGRRPYPSDKKDDEWAFFAPYLTLMTQDAPQRVHGLRHIFDAMRWIVRAGAPWRYMPGDFPPWEAVYQQARRWIEAGVFERMVHDLRETLRLAEGRQAQPTAVIVDGRVSGSPGPITCSPTASDESLTIRTERISSSEIKVIVSGNPGNPCVLFAPGISFSASAWIRNRCTPAKCLSKENRVEANHDRFPDHDLKIAGGSVLGFPFGACSSGTTPGNLLPPAFNNYVTTGWTSF